MFDDIECERFAFRELQETERNMFIKSLPEAFQDVLSVVGSLKVLIQGE